MVSDRRLFDVSIPLTGCRMPHDMTHAVPLAAWLFLICCLQSLVLISLLGFSLVLSCCAEWLIRHLTGVEPVLFAPCIVIVLVAMDRRAQMRCALLWLTARSQNMCYVRERNTKLRPDDSRICTARCARALDPSCLASSVVVAKSNSCVQQARGTNSVLGASNA